MSVTYHDETCLDCERTTTVASDEPPENQRCVRCWQKHLEGQR